MAQVQELRAPTARTSVSKRIGWHIARKEPHATVLVIGPDDARDLIERNVSDNWRNRPLSASTLSGYVRDMERGNWRLTGEGLIFSKTGRLLNGQHRLFACIKSGYSFETFVSFGVEDREFAYIDRAKIRTAGDIFGADNEESYTRAAAAAMWVWRYENGRMSTSSAPDKPNNAELLDYYRYTHPGLRDSLDAGKWFAHRKEKIVAPALMMALHYLCAQQDRVLADDFFKSFATGAGLRSTRAPGYLLRDKMLGARLAGARINDNVAAAITVIAWNAVRSRGRLSSKSLVYSSDQPFPQII